MALKVKGAKKPPKAGPKKKRAKSEAEAINAAVEEHGSRGIKKGKRQSKVRTYTYKEVQVEKRKKADRFLAEQERLFGTRVPEGPSEFDVFKSELEDDKTAFAEMYWQMECPHAHEEDLMLTSSFVEGTEPSHVRCKRCHVVRKWWGTKTETKLKEWLSYCPDGIDMFDWQDMYVKDRSLWRFIHDEVLEEQLAKSLTSEEE